jgi:hypothetical protein
MLGLKAWSEDLDDDHAATAAGDGFGSVSG